MRALLLLTVLALATTAPLATAEVSAALPLPVATSLPLVPALSCTTVYDSPSENRCSVASRASAINEITVRSTGMRNVHVVFINEDTNTQLAAFDCASTCRVTFPAQAGRLFLLVLGQPAGTGAAATVSAHWNAQDVLTRVVPMPTG